LPKSLAALDDATDASLIVRELRAAAAPLQLAVSKSGKLADWL
jgi:hypothetical protein